MNFRSVVNSSERSSRDDWRERAEVSSSLEENDILVKCDRKQVLDQKLQHDGLRGNHDRRAMVASARG